MQAYKHMYDKFNTLSVYHTKEVVSRGALKSLSMEGIQMSGCKGMPGDCNCRCCL